MKRKGKNKELLIHLSTSIILEVITFIELWKIQGSGVGKTMCNSGEEQNIGEGSSMKRGREKPGIRRNLSGKA